MKQRAGHSRFHTELENAELLLCQKGSAGSDEWTQDPLHTGCVTEELCGSDNICRCRAPLWTIGCAVEGTVRARRCQSMLESFAARMQP